MKAIQQLIGYFEGRGRLSRLTLPGPEAGRHAIAGLEDSQPAGAQRPGQAGHEVTHVAVTLVDSSEVAAEGMPTATAAQVTLLARFYERLGDHAVNLVRRIELLRRNHA